MYGGVAIKTRIAKGASVEGEDRILAIRAERHREAATADPSDFDSLYSWALVLQARSPPCALLLSSPRRAVSLGHLPIDFHFSLLSSVTHQNLVWRMLMKLRRCRPWKEEQAERAEAAGADVTRREDFLVEACMKYDAAHQLRPSSLSTLYNWQGFDAISTCAARPPIELPPSFEKFRRYNRI